MSADTASNSSIMLEPSRESRFALRASNTLEVAMEPTRSTGPPGPMKLMYPFFKLFFRDDGGKGASVAARSTIWAATSSELAGVTGRYFDTHMQEQPLHPTAYDGQVQARILDVIAAAESR